MNTFKQSQTTPEWADERFITATRGITHTPLFNLRKAGKIRSLSLKVDGAKYGKRLYHVPTIDAFLASLEERDIQADAVARQAHLDEPSSNPILDRIPARKPKGN